MPIETAVTIKQDPYRRWTTIFLASVTVTVWLWKYATLNLVSATAGAHFFPPTNSIPIPKNWTHLSNFSDEADFEAMKLAAVTTDRQRELWSVLVGMSKSNESVHMRVLGGSHAAGIGCASQQNQGFVDGFVEWRECAWSARFSRWLKQTYMPNIVFENAARGGTKAVDALTSLSSLLYTDHLKFVCPNITVLDFSINDCFQAMDLLKYKVSPQQTTLTWASAVGLTYAKLLISIRKLCPKTVVMVMLSSSPNCVRNLELSDKIRDATSSHGAILIDLQQACVEGNLCPWKHSKEDIHNVHSDWQVHQVYAEVAAFSAHRAFTGVYQGYYSSERLDRFQSCLTPLSLHSAFDVPKSRYVDQKDRTGAWDIYEDRPGKPGWVASATSNITFNLAFGTHPGLLVSYIKSYEGFGNAELVVNNRSVILKGQWDDSSQRVTTTYTRWFHASSKDYQEHIYGDIGLTGFGVASYSSSEAMFKFVANSSSPAKFVLISVSSC